MYTYLEAHDIDAPQPAPCGRREFVYEVLRHEDRDAVHLGRRLEARRKVHIGREVRAVDLNAAFKDGFII